LSPLSSHVLSPPLPLTHPPTSLDFDLDREAPAARLFLSLPTTASHLPRRAIRGAPPPSFFSPTPTGDGGERGSWDGILAIWCILLSFCSLIFPLIS
uniref:Uncharacterized protein n=1 Tax=Aegilops tauschii subsp. strangulata TaxID=200361 RepID=A0A453N5Z0_AEGTS